MHGLASGAEQRRRGSSSCSQQVGLARRRLRPLSARVQRRPAPAHRHRARARGRAALHRRRRAGLGARRLDPGADREPAAGSAGRSWGSPISSSRTTCGSWSTSATASRSCTSADRRDGRQRASSTATRAIRTRARCCRPCRCPTRAARAERIALRGDVPSPLNPPAGCAFHPRCPHAVDACRAQEPKLVTGARDHAVACHVFPPEP